MNVKLADLLHELGISKVKLSKFLGVSRQMIYNYLELDDINKWPKDKKVLMLNLLGVKNAEDIKDIKVGDKLIGISSSGLHSNGYSLVRKLFTDLKEDIGGKEAWETLITPTKIYVKPILKLLERFEIKGMAHITGGGFIENVPRMFNKEGLTAVINKDSYPLPLIFEKIIEKGVDKDHMYNTFNMGIGFVLCVNEEDVDSITKALIEMGEKAYEIGYITSGGEGCCLR